MCANLLMMRILQMHKTREKISSNMPQIKLKDTRIEIMLKKNSKKIFGKSDMVFIGKKLRRFVTVNFEFLKLKETLPDVRRL